jgi:sugar transferase (PEP-CTERM/EpsH1 system associated)
MAQYAGEGDEIRIVDFVDVDSEKWRDYARLRRWPLSWVFRREARLLLEIEGRAAAEADTSLFVSAEEAALFERRAGAAIAIQRPNIRVVENGVDTARFNPERPWSNPYAPGSPVLVFVGRMDYWANMDGVQWFAKEILPRVLTRFPDLRFFVVGAGPVQNVRALSDGRRIFATGRVLDVRPYLRHADLAVVPLRVARGIQNKALEAMAMAKAVVATGAAFEGIDAVPGRDLMVAEGADRFAEAVVTLLGDEAARERMGRGARAVMMERYSWSTRLRTLDTLIDGLARASPASVDEVQAAEIRKGKPTCAVFAASST